ncbi:protein kinase [Anaeramoeba flamelloides]|uniref:Protein kinase n=1 Tax=Anaeramoeba flamelloides TaxID=1746091 RepID=A0AAV7Z813_9EUKA|nr:protein kinase [Anaeramoeba flamelloides]
MSLQKIGPYIIGSTIGEGSFSKVKWAINPNTKKEVAVKIISKTNLVIDQKNMDRVRTEIAIQKLIDHPNIIKIYDVYETEKHLFLILEYVSGGELFEYILESGRVESNQSRKFFQQIIYGLEQIHSFSISHRDLKPENLLLDEDNNIKIADFGLAKMIKSDGLLETACGSPHYVSPEVIRGKGYDGKKSDIWSCGVILYALLCGKLPFDQSDYNDLFLNISLGEYEFPSFLGELEKDLISKMLVVDSEKRISIKEIKRHPWFTFNFPKNYLPPSPPIDYGKGLEKPIELDEMDDEIVKELSQLGIMNWIEVIEELQSKGKNSIKIFYNFYLKHSRQQSKFDQDEEEKVVPKRERKKSLPLKKRRNSITKTRGMKTPPRKKISKNNSKQENESEGNNGTNNKNNFSKNMKSDKILHLRELIEKTEKQNDLEMSEYSQIMNQSCFFKDVKSTKKQKEGKKNKLHSILDNEDEIKNTKLGLPRRKIKNEKKKKPRRRSFSLAKSYRRQDITKSPKKNKKFVLKSPIAVRKFKFKKFQKKNKTKKNRIRKGNKQKTTKKILNNNNLSLEKKNKIKKKIFPLRVDVRTKNNVPKKEMAQTKDKKQDSNTNSSKKKMKLNITIPPQLQRTSKKNMKSFMTPRQEEIINTEKRWFKNTVTKKEQKKLNHKLKKQLKRQQKKLMKQLKANQNIPVFIAQNKIIALSSANTITDLIAELQTAFTICNYDWSYPNFTTLKGNIGKLGIKVKVIKKDIDSLLDLVSVNMVDCLNAKFLRKSLKKNKMSHFSNSSTTSLSCSSTSSISSYFAVDELKKDDLTFHRSRSNGDEESLVQIKQHVLNNLDSIDPMQKRDWKMAIEFVWKSGSAKKFIEETENLIRFLSQ